MQQMASLLWRLALLACAGLIALMALAAWAIAPFPIEPALSWRTAGWMARAPLADKIVIGDSRIEWAQPSDQALFVGYGGATFIHLERVTKTLCALSDAPIVIALGVNDAKPARFNADASLASAQAMVSACSPDRVTLAKIWPTDPDTPPAGQDYDLGAMAMLDTGLQTIATRSGAKVLPAPQLTGHTIDGVHFTPAVSRQYLAFLADNAT